MGQGQTKEELKQAIQSELGAYFVYAHAPSSSASDPTLSSSCTALVETSKLSHWLGEDVRSGSRTTNYTSSSATKDGHTDISSIWTRLDPVNDSEEQIESSTPSLEAGNISDPSTPTKRGKATPFEERLMSDSIILDTTRPVVIEVIRKNQLSAFSIDASLSRGNQPPPSSLLSEPVAETSATSATKGTPLSKRPSSLHLSPSQLEDTDSDNGDVTVIDYLSELDGLGKRGSRYDKCRFFAVADKKRESTSEGDSSSGAGQSMETERGIINEWFERAHVAILNSTEIGQLNELIAKSNAERSAASAASRSTDSSRSLDSSASSLAVSVDLSASKLELDPSTPLMPLIPVDHRNSSDQRRFGTLSGSLGTVMPSSVAVGEQNPNFRGIVNLEHTPASEARQVAAPHPNMLAPLKIVEGPEHLFVLMPYHRYTLETVFRFSPGVLDTESKRTFLVYQLLRTLQWLHHSELVHGDLKPHNVKLTQRLWMTLGGAAFGPNGLSAASPSISSIPTLSKENWAASTLAVSSNRNSKSISETVSSHSRTGSNSSSYGASSLLHSTISASAVTSAQASKEEISLSRFVTVQPLHSNSERQLATTEWVEGRMSNFDYLIKLNEWAGRTTGDPNFHPVMPWVIDFSSPTSWRDLTKTKFRLNKGDEQLDFTYANPVPVSMTQGGGKGDNSNSRSSYGPRSEATSAPYHINDTLTELTYYNYFARRTPLCLLRKYVRTNFVPAEYPSTMERLYQWSPDECIPEFYSDPSIFESLNPELPDLAVPAWAGGDVRRFLSLHRDALENEHVSRLLHQWIDLTFGYKLSGEAGKLAKNVALMDRNSHRNHGFVQLFIIPHPPRRKLAPVSSSISRRQSLTLSPTNSSILGPPNSPSTSASLLSILPTTPVLIGSASGITSSFTSATPESSSGLNNRGGNRKSVRPGSVMLSPGTVAGANPAGAGQNTAPPAVSIFASLPKITLSRPTMTTTTTVPSTWTPAPVSAATITSPSMTSANVPLTNSATAVQGSSSTPTGTSESIAGPEGSQSSSPAPGTPTSDTQGEERSLNRSTGPKAALHRQISASAVEMPTTVSGDSMKPLIRTPSESAVTHTAPMTFEDLHAESEPVVVYGLDSTLSTEDPYASGGSSAQMFHMSTDALPSPPTMSPASTSPMGDDLETYQAHHHSATTSSSTASVTPSATGSSPAPQSVSTPASTNPLLVAEPSGSPKTSAKSLSHSTGTMVPPPGHSSTTESLPTAKPTRSSLGPAPNAAAASPPQSSSKYGSGSGSPKDRSEKEKEKSSFRREFLKIMGTIADGFSSDKKAPHAGHAPTSTSKDMHYATQPYGNPATGQMLPGTPPTVDPKSADSSFRGKSSSHSKSVSEHVVSPVPSMAVSDISLTESSHSVGVEDEPAPLSSSMLLKQINSSPAGGFSEDGSSQPIGGQAGLHAPNRAQQQQKSSAYIEDIISGEYQSRFLTQVSLLEPIFTAPFASFQFPLSVFESDETDLGKLEKDRAKCCDLFAAGCLIYQLLSGVPLFTKDNISQYLEGDGTWWWGSASQPIPRRFKSLVFELVLAGRPYFAYAIQNGLSVGYVTSAILGSASTVSGGDSNTTEVQMDDPFDFGRARLTPQQTASIATNTPTSTTSSQQTTTSAVVSASPAPGVPTPPSAITLANLGQLSEGIIDKFLNDDLISAPTSMKVFPSHFELAYQFLCRYHSTTSWNKRVTLALDNIGFLVNLPLSGLDLILPDLLSFFDHQESVVDALALIEPLAIKMGKVMTIEKLLGPVVGLYERIQRQQQHHHQQTSSSSSSSSSSTHSSSSGTGAHQSSSMDHSVQLALELLASRFVHTLLSKFGQTCFLKHIVGFLVNEVRSTKKEIGFAAGSALLRLVSILSPPIYIRHVLYPLLTQLNKANTEVLSATLVEIGARMGEDVILRHHMEVIIPLLQLHIFQKEDAISVRISTTLLRLISSLVGLLHPTKILPTMMMDHRCLFSVLLNPPSDRGVWDALLDCLSSVSSAIGLHNAIKYARPYVQQFFSIYGNAPSTAATSEVINDSSKSYPTMVMMRFKDLLDVRSGGGNVSIQQALGPALRIESYLMGPTMASSTAMPASTLPTIAPPTVMDDDSPSTTVLPSVTTLGHSGSVVSPSATRISQSASSISSQESNGSSDSGSNTLTVPTPVTGSSTTDSSNSDQTSERPIAPRRLSSPVRPVSPTLTALVNPPALNADSSKDSPAVILRLATANEDGHVADAMPTWLANLHGAPYVPQVQLQQSGSTQSSGRNLNASLASGANPTSAGGGSAPSANPPTSPAASAGISTGGGGASSAMTSPLGSGVGGSISSSHGTNAPTATGSGSGAGSTQTGNERIPPKKALHILGSQASTPMAPGLPNPSAPWDTLQESTVTPAVLPPFGPAVTQSPFGAGWPPTHGPSQTWNFTGISGHSFREHSGAIRCVSVHDNERLFLSGSKDTTVKCWDLLSEGSSRQTYSGHKFPINQAEFVDRGNLVASSDGSIHVWELERGTKLTHMDAYSVSAHASNSSLAKGEGGGGPSALFTCFASHQDGRVLVCGTSLSTVTFTDLRAEQEVVCEWYLPTTIPGTSTSSSSSSSSGSSTGSSSGISSGSASISSAGAAAYPRAISLGHIDQNLMVVGQSSGHMTLIDIRSGLLLYNWRAHEGPISSVKAVPDASGYLVSSSLDKTIYLWDIANANQTSPVGLTQFRGHSDSHISFDTFRGNLYSVSGQKIAIAPLFGQPSSVLLDKRKLIKTNALKLTNMLTSFNILQLQHLALVGYDDGSIKVTQ